VKRKSQERLNAELRLCIKRTRRRLKRRGARTRTTRPRLPRVASRADGTVQLAAPEVFEIADASARRELLFFLNRLRRFSVAERRGVRISFAETRRMVSGGTLLFVAELHRIRRILGSEFRISCSYPQSDKVEQVLQQVGVLRLLRKPERLTPTADDVIHWVFIDGALAEGEKANQLIEAFSAKLPKQVIRDLYDGLVEAMTNCVHHAYIDTRGDGLNIRSETGWWMFAQEREQKLSVVICDLGVGIPRSLPRTHDPNVLTSTLEKIARAANVKGFRDVDYISAALELRKTRTGESHRGLGLIQFRDVVEDVDQGSLFIFSNKGAIQIRTHRPNVGEFKHEFSDSILGTIVHWSIPLSQAVEPNHDDK